MTEKYTPARGDYIKVQGNKQYLPVPARVQWFRGEHPDWTIHTSVVELAWTEGYAVMRAEVLDDTGRLIASGMKTETRKGFGDFVEKAETGAVGRALARAGYGTEDALDLEGDRYADAPIQQPDRSGGPAKAASTPSRSDPVQRTPEESTLLEMIQLAAVERGISKSGLSLISDAVGVPKGQHANAVQLAAILERIEAPASGVPVAPGVGEGGAISPSPSDAAQPESPPSPAAPTTRTVEEAIADAEAKAKAKVPA